MGVNALGQMGCDRVLYPKLGVEVGKVWKIRLCQDTAYASECGGGFAIPESSGHGLLTAVCQRSCAIASLLPESNDLLLTNKCQRIVRRLVIERVAAFEVKSAISVIK